MWNDDRDDENDLDECDGYVVLIADATTGELDCYGPFHDVAGAATHVMSAREDLCREEFDGVVVELVRWHRR
ncbi:hypothetical protein [Actinomycetospora flava]|uniref:Uncharacterized protein n=1 Tax=Actinomycetospora flava TaxID=3129232 RepID=A0ABU8MBR1_9PSEU